MSRTRLSMVVVAVMLGLVSCGGNGDRALTVPGPTASALPNGDAGGSPGAPSTANAQAALLTLDDLPAGWTVDLKKINSNKSKGFFSSLESEETSDGPASGECARVAHELKDQKPITEAATAFTAGSSKPDVMHSVSFFDEDTVPLVERLATVLGGCPEALWKQDKSPSFDYRMQPLSFPDLGDRTVAVRLVATSGMNSVTFDFVAVAMDRAMSILLVGGFDPLDGSELERLARLSVDRIS